MKSPISKPSDKGALRVRWWGGGACRPRRLAQSFCAGRQALYKLSAESRDILRGCSSDMCQQSWLPDGAMLPDAKEPCPGGLGRDQRARGNVVARRTGRKIRGAKSVAA